MVKPIRPTEIIIHDKEQWDEVVDYLTRPPTEAEKQRMRDLMKNHVPSPRLTKEQRYKFKVEAQIHRENPRYSDSFIDELMDRFYWAVIETYGYELNVEHAAEEIMRIWRLDGVQRDSTDN